MLENSFEKGFDALTNRSIDQKTEKVETWLSFLGEEFFTVCESCHAANFSRFTVSSSQPV